MILLVLAILFLQANNVFAQVDLPYRDVTLQITQDAYFSNRTLSGFGRDKYLIVGDGGTRDVYIKYDPSPLSSINVLPKDIIHSHLHIYQEDNFEREAVAVDILPIIEYWHEQQLETKPLFGETISIGILTPDLQSWQELDITTAVKYGLENSDDYYGFALSTLDSSSSVLWSKDCVKGTRLPLCKAEEKPFITVRYWINNLPSKPILIAPKHQSVTDKFKQEFRWEPSIDPEGDEIQYMLEISTDNEFEDILTFSPWITEIVYEQTLPGIGEYFWRVRARDEHLAHGEVTSETSTVDIIQSITVETIVEEIQEITSSIKEKVVYITQKDPREDSIQEVLGIQSIREQIQSLTSRVGNNKCNIKFIENKLSKQRCSISSFILKEVFHKKIGSNYQITFTGEIDEGVQISVESVSCKEWKILDPTTWFTNCKKAAVEKTELEINIDTIIYPKYEDKRLALVNHKAYKGEFDVTYESKDDLSGKKVELFRQSFASRSVHGNSFEIQKEEGFKATIPKAVDSNPTQSQGLGFPFRQWVGVTQWHGNTAYQRPHTGIDFGVSRKPIYSPEDGVIRSAQWDSYYGKCLSGGNVLRIEHSSGKHSVYMHLADYNKSNGKEWRVGEVIQKGEQVGITGNSGAYNCQALGYHLHFEVRSARPQSTHTDPTKQIDIDWEMVPTLGFNSYPGRLTGDNPHPGR